MTDRQIIAKIKQLKEIRPSNIWKEALRKELIFKAKKAFPKEREAGFFIFKKIRLFKLQNGYNWKGLTGIKSNLLSRFVAVNIILIIILGFGIITIQAAKDSIPGDILYPVKIATEKAELLLVKNRGNKVKLETGLAARRLDELQQIIQSQKQEKVVESIKNFQEKLEIVENRLKDLKKKQEGKEIIEIAKVVDTKTAEFENILDRTQKGPSVPEETKKKIVTVKEIAEKVNTQALKVMVEMKTQEDEEEVLVRIEDKIKRVEEKMENSEVEIILEKAKEELAKKNFFIALENIEKIQEIKSDKIEEETKEVIDETEKTETQSAGEELEKTREIEEKTQSIGREKESKKEAEKRKEKREVKELDESKIKADFKGDLLFEPEKEAYGGLLRERR